MRKSIPFSEVLRRVMDEKKDAFSSFNEEVVGDLAIDRSMCAIGVNWWCGSKSNIEPYLFDSALLNDDDVVGEISHANFFILVFFCIHFLVVGM